MMNPPPQRPSQTPNPNPSADDATTPPADSAGETTPHAGRSAAAGRLPAELPAAFGRYRLLKLLGRGGMGSVYLAHDTQLDRPVALKVPHFTADDDPNVLARFHREARAAATVVHPNVCPLHDVGEHDGVPYLTMAFVEGKPLAEVVAARPPTPRQSALLVRKLALALQEAHKKGVIHRDLKPANVMIDRCGEPVVMDFGLARRSRSGDARLTHDGLALGTPAYMPPEQVSGDVEAMGPACDVYSLGVILYELLTGRLPFQGESMAVLAQVLLDEPPAPRTLRPDLDPELEAVCLKAMAKKPQDRYASMADLAAALFEYLRKKGPASGPAPAPPAPAAEAPTEGFRTSRMGGLRSVAVLHAEAPARKAPDRPPPRPRRRKGGRRGVPWWVWVGGGAAAVLLPVLAWVVYRATDYGTIRINLGGAPDRVEMTVDDEPGHHSGDAFRLHVGSHHLIRVADEDYEPLTQAFAVRRGDNPDLLVSLTPKYGTVPIRLSDAKAPVRVWIDGVLTPAADLAGARRLPTGKHVLAVSGEGYEKVTEDFTVRAGQNPPLAVRLQLKSEPEPTRASEARPPEASPRPAPAPAAPREEVRFAAVWEKRSGPEWEAFRDLSPTDFQKRFESLGARGFRLVAVSGYSANGDLRYAGIWEKRPGPLSVARGGLNGEEYQKAFDALGSQGYHLTFLSSYSVGGEPRYAGIWEPGPGLDWEAHHGMSADDYQKTFDALTGQGYRLAMVNGCDAGGVAVYAAVWEKRPGPPLVTHAGLSAEGYQRISTRLAGQGFHLKFLDAYSVGGEARFAAVWEKRPAPDQEVFHGLTADEFHKEFDRLKTQGYRLVSVCGYSVRAGR